MPVPPLATGSTSVTSVLKETSDVAMAPAEALRKPFKEPIVSDGVESAPVLEMVVVPVPPMAAVFEENAEVEAFETRTVEGSESATPPVPLSVTVTWFAVPVIHVEISVDVA